MKKSRRHLIYDPFVVSRVKQYLEENTHQTHVNVADMARALQDKYRDYNRRKTAPFRQLVEHAYQIVLQSYGLGSNTNSEVDDDEEQSDGSIELLDEDSAATRNKQNFLGDAMNSLYTKKPTTEGSSATAVLTVDDETRKRPQDSVPIDISSDEEESSKDPGNGIDVNNIPIPIQTEAPAAVLPNGIDATTAGNGSNNTDGESQLLRVTKKRKLNPVAAPALVNIKPPSTGGSKKTLSAKKEFPVKESILTFADVGGLDKILRDLCELLLHLKHPELYVHIGLTAPRGFLLHGPPGSGKTLLAQAIAGQLKVPLIEVAATELVAGISGESEERIREVFEKAASVAPCVLFIDEVDVISANRNNAQKDLERRIVSQLLSSLDGLGHLPNGNKVVVVGATNRADTLDPALRRVGRFDQEICLGIPDRKAREQILGIVCKNLLLEDPFKFDDLAVLTPGYVGADLLALAMRAATIAVRRAFSLKDFEKPPVEITTEQTLPEKDVRTEEPQKENNDQQVQMEVDCVPGNDVDTPAAIQEIETVPPSAEKPGDDQVVGMEEGPQPLPEGNLNPEKSKQHTLEEMLRWLDCDEDSPLTKEDIQSLRVTMADFKAALSVVQPSAKREGFITVPDVTWEDIGSLQDIRDELKLAILAPVKYPERLEQLGLQSPSGVLLCGPPGCGKTLLAKAVANEAGVNFISVKGPELLNMYVGESERAVRQCFQRAKNSAPCVIFFDEFDALCPKRSNRSENTSGARVVNQLLTEMDGVEDRRGVFLMAATNRPDMIDGAVLRPGRLDKILYVGLPECVEREDILRALTKNATRPPLGEDVDFADLAKSTEGFTGADLGGLVREASLQALKESLLAATADKDGPAEDLRVHKKHFLSALKNIKPSVTEEDKRNYSRLQKLYGSKDVTVA